MLQRSVQALLSRLGFPARILAGAENEDQELFVKREIVVADKGVRSR